MNVGPEPNDRDVTALRENNKEASMGSELEKPISRSLEFLDFLSQLEEITLGNYDRDFELVRMVCW